MSRRSVDTLELKAFLGGIDYDSSPFDMPEDCLLNSSNVLPPLSVGAFTVINGYQPQNPNSQIEESSVPVTINGLISFYNQNGNTEYFVGQAGSDIWSNSPEGTWSKITGGITITSSQNNLASMVNLNNILYGVDRSEDQLWYWLLTGNCAAVPVGGLYTVVINNGGTGYVVGDILTITGGSGTGGTVTVTGVTDPNGVINSIEVTPGSGVIPVMGSGYVPTISASISGGTGSGATVSINAVTPQINGNFLTNFNNTLFVNGGTSLPTGLYYSDLNLGFSINPINYLLFNTGQGNYLTGAVNALFGNLFVFKNKSIHLVSPTGSIPAYSNQLYIDGIGCVSHQSIVTLPGGDIMFWDTDDIYRITGTQVYKATLHPKKGTPRLRNFFRNYVNANRLKYVCGTYYAALDCVFWFFSSPSSNNNDQCLAFHVPTSSFWPLTLRGTSCAQRVIQNESFLYTGDINGFIYEQDNGGSFSGSNISWSSQIPWQDCGDITLRKKGDLVYAIVQNETGNPIYYDIYLNQSPYTYQTNNLLQTIQLTFGGAQFDTAVFDTSIFSGEQTQLMEASGLIQTLFKSISINFHGTCNVQPMTMYRVALSTRSLQFTRLTD